MLLVTRQIAIIACDGGILVKRYLPGSIQVPGHLHWSYTTDKVGNILRIRDELVPASTRDYGYQDHQYYLTRGDGPWGDLSWTYDRLGNRLTETRDGVRTDYTYTPNAAGKSSAKLASTRPASTDAETTTYGFDAAGNQIHQTTPSSKVVYTYDDAKRLAEIRSRDADRLQVTAIEYDGRSFLKRAALSLIGDRPFESRVTTATYSSEGVLHHKTNDERPTPWSLRGTPRVSGDDYVFYFAGRPVAQLGVEVTSGVEVAKWLFLTADHLGTPVLAAGQDGVKWLGGFEPFGVDYVGASDAGIFLRFPGQWTDEELFVEGVVYNVFRWYNSINGVYMKSDPIGMIGGVNALLYVVANPLSGVDPMGLQRGDFHVPDSEEIEEMIQRSCARRAFYRNYYDMKESNWKRSDKYFHCKANCEATKCGEHGQHMACEISDLRELSDRLIKGDTQEDVEADQLANRYGRNQAVKHPDQSCQISCEGFRPRGLPEKY